MALYSASPSVAGGNEKLMDEQSTSPAHVASDARLKIGLMHREHTSDIRSWSGLSFFIGQALQRHVGDVVYLGPDTTFGSKLLSYTRKQINAVTALLFKKDLVWDDNRLTSWRVAHLFGQRLQEEAFDVIVAPAASVEIAYLKTDLPIIYLSDSTWHNIVDYYQDTRRISGIGKREIENIEARAIRRADAVVLPSLWPVRTAIDHYRAAPEKVFQIPFGANLLEVPEHDQACSHILGETIELLWVGVEWERKGGDIAVQCMRDLKRRGYAARLTVCGCSPPAELRDDPDIRALGFLDKREPAQRSKLTAVYLESHFFLFPTRAEAYGIVVAEASAHGLPCLATDTGGVSGVLLDQRNGFLMPLDADGTRYAEKIAAIVGDPGVFQELVRSSRRAFEETLNWDHWGKSMQPIIHAAIERRKRR